MEHGVGLDARLCRSDPTGRASLDGVLPNGICLLLNPQCPPSCVGSIGADEIPAQHGTPNESFAKVQSLLACDYRLVQIRGQTRPLVKRAGTGADTRLIDLPILLA
jgi:hypothetical protein